MYDSIKITARISQVNKIAQCSFLLDKFYMYVCVYIYGEGCLFLFACLFIDEHVKFF